MPSYIKWKAISKSIYNLGVDAATTPPSSPFHPVECYKIICVTLSTMPLRPRMSFII